MKTEHNTKNNIYIVSGRYGDEMKDPAWFGTMEEAEGYVKSEMAAAIRKDPYYIRFSRNDNVDNDNDEAVIEWAEDCCVYSSWSAKDRCDSTCKYDATCTLGDHTEYCIDRLTVENTNGAFIISSMYGYTMNTPTICYTEEEAKSMIRADIADCIREGAEGEEFKDDDEAFRYAEEHDLCRSYHVDGVYDTYTGGEDWTQYRIDRLEL